MQEAVRIMPSTSECKCQDPENCKRELESEEDKEAKIDHVDKQILAVSSSAAGAYIPLSNAFGEGIWNHSPNCTDRQANAQQGMTNGHSYFFFTEQ